MTIDMNLKDLLKDEKYTIKMDDIVRKVKFIGKNDDEYNFILLHDTGRMTYFIITQEEFDEANPHNITKGIIEKKEENSGGSKKSRRRRTKKKRKGTKKKRKKRNHKKRTRRRRRKRRR